VLPTPRPRRAALAVVVALLALAGCSADGSDDAASSTTEAATSTTAAVASTTEATTTTEADDGASDAEQDYVDAVADAMREVEDSEFPIDDEQADCLAPRWVDAIGYETLLEAGVTPEVLGGTEDGDIDAEFEDVVDRPRAEKLVDAFFDCGLDLEGTFYEGLASDGSATPEQVQCLRDRLPEGFVRELMITSMDGGDEALDEDDELEQQLTDAFLACVGEG
jgi:hypothetical protein